ncbi:MAG: dephospho-CoA kinase [Clostridia bacterium]|nr:dephospho-CoA kinase [Clostridia bacterium]MBQ2190965.1 dephospho-CoA kinase [Clostridia bacterium]
MILGLTGSMASGKSTVSAMLKEYGLYVLDADEEAHAVLELPAAASELAALFGEDILDEGGAVVRARLAEKAFASAEETAKLNAVIHPAVIRAMLEKAEEFLLEYPEIPVVFDVPLLFESGMDRLCDRVVTVAADDEVRYLRIMLRDGLTREQASRRIARQTPQEEKIARSDAVVFNNGTLTELRAEVGRVLSELGLGAFLPEGAV